MTQTDALKALAKKVELGQFRPHFEGPEHTIWPGMDDGNSLKRHHLRYAYYGDLNAAKALHDALLPRWDCDICIRPGMMSDVAIFPPHATTECEPYWFASHDNTARAWLLSILRAEIAKENSDD